MNLQLFEKIRQDLIEHPETSDMTCVSALHEDTRLPFIFRIFRGVRLIRCECICGKAERLSGQQRASWDYTHGAELLGIPEELALDLFTFHCNPTEHFEDLGIAMSRSKAGTREYADIMIAAIDRCISIVQGRLRLDGKRWIYDDPTKQDKDTAVLAG